MPRRTPPQPTAARNPLPRHLAVSELLRGDVRSGRFGARLPSEPELAVLYAVSRTTLRRAIHLLTEEGVLAAQHGSGTYVQDAQQATRTVGLIVAQGLETLDDDPYFQQLAFHLLQACSLAGWTLRLAASAADMRQRLTAGRNHAVSACIAGFFGSGDISRVLESFPVPLVLVDSDPLPGAPCILADNTDGMRQAVEHLVALGHRRIAHVPLPGYSAAGRERWQSFTDSMAKAGLPVLADPLSDDHSGRGYAAMQRWRHAAEQPTAIVFGNDLLALGALDWLAEHGLHAGRDVSIVGCDGLLAGRLAAPHLATVALDFRAHAAAVVDAVLHPTATVRRTAVRLQTGGTLAPPSR